MKMLIKALNKHFKVEKALTIKSAEKIVMARKRQEFIARIYIKITALELDRCFKGMWKIDLMDVKN